MSYDNTTKRKPDYEVFQIVEIDGKGNSKFYDVGIGFVNRKADDGSINLMTVHGKLQIRVIDE